MRMYDEPTGGRVPIGRFLTTRHAPEHLDIEATAVNGWASWWCRRCDTACALGAPCRHCVTAHLDWVSTVDQLRV